MNRIVAPPPVEVISYTISLLENIRRVPPIEWDPSVSLDPDGWFNANSKVDGIMKEYDDLMRLVTDELTEDQTISKDDLLSLTELHLVEVSNMEDRVTRGKVVKSLSNYTDAVEKILPKNKGPFSHGNVAPEGFEKLLQKFSTTVPFLVRFKPTKKLIGIIPDAQTGVYIERIEQMGGKQRKELLSDVIRRYFKNTIYAIHDFALEVQKPGYLMV